LLLDYAPVLRMSELYVKYIILLEIVVNKIITMSSIQKQNTVNYSCKNPLLKTRETLFIALTFENYERCFFYEILILIKTKNINVCCFQDITN